MHPDDERAAMRKAGIVPISFNAPTDSCAGVRHPNGKPYGVCCICALQGPAGIEPAARLIQGHAQCVNHQPHAANTGDGVGFSVGAEAHGNEIVGSPITTAQPLASHHSVGCVVSGGERKGQGA